MLLLYTVHKIFSCYTFVDLKDIKQLSFFQLEKRGYYSDSRVICVSSPLY